MTDLTPILHPPDVNIRALENITRRLQRHIYGPPMRLFVELQAGAGELRVIGVTTAENGPPVSCQGEGPGV